MDILIAGAETAAVSTDADPRDDAGTDAPGTGVTIFEVYGPSAQRRPSLRRLPRLAAHGVRVVWAAGRHQFVAVVALQAVAGVGVAGQLLLAGELVGDLSAAQDSTSMSGLIGLVAALVVVTLVVAALQTVSRLQDDILAELVDQHVKRRILDVTCAVELNEFDNPAFHDRVQRATMGAAVGPWQLVQGVNTVAGAVLGIVGIGGALLVLEPILVPVVLVAAVPLWIAGVRQGQAYWDFIGAITPAERERAYLHGLLTARNSAAEVRAFGLADFLRGRWAERSAERLAGLRRVASAQLRAALLGGSAIAALLGAALVGLIALVASGRTTLAETAAVAGGLLLLAQRLRAASVGTDLLLHAAPFVGDLRDFLSLEPRLRARPAVSPPLTTIDWLAVDHVSFTYPQADRPAIDDLSLEIEAGQVVALVGANGSGKTTLAKLLCGLYLPQHGRITLDGVDISTMDASALRRRVAVLFQDFLRYTLTGAANVAVGDVTRADDRPGIVAAAQLAGAHDFLSALPSGYDTLLGPEFEGGQDLSLGQWQRVALARAFFRNADFLVLDEPTAALDARAEAELFDTVRRLYAGRTVLLISHRFSSVRSADRIFVLDRGRIVERGDHDGLMAHGGLYAELFTLQSASYQP